MKNQVPVVMGLCLLMLFIGWRTVVVQPQQTLSAYQQPYAPYPLHLPIVLAEGASIAAPISLTSTPLPTITVTPVVTMTATPTITPTPVPQGPAHTRFNFEVAGHVARDGHCTMHRTTGDLLLTWETEAGFEDSANHPEADANGWIPVDIPFVNIFVEVFCDDGSGPIRMDIYNGVPHPDSGAIVGWLSREIQHAVEIGWPGE